MTLIDIGFDVISTGRSILPKWRFQNSVGCIRSLREALHRERLTIEDQIRALDGAVYSTDLVYETLMYNTPLTNAEVIDIIRTAKRGATDVYKALSIRVDIPPPFANLIPNLTWLDYYHRLLSGLEDKLELKVYLGKHMTKLVNATKREYNNLILLVETNLLFLLQEARQGEIMSPCLVGGELILKIKRHAKIEPATIEGVVERSVDTVRKEITEIVKKEEALESRIPQDLVIKLMVFRWRDLLLTDMEDQLAVA